MGEKQEKVAKVGDHLSTARQVEFVLDLYEETGYKKRYPVGVLDTMPQKEIQPHIDYLKGYKARKLSVGEANGRVNGFNDAAFGMIYKLCWNAEKKKDVRDMLHPDAFKEVVYCEYYLYKDARDYAKRKVAEAGA